MRINKTILSISILISALIGAEVWENCYQRLEVEQMPWFYEQLDPDVEQVLDMHNLHEGNVLEIGTGPGTQAIELARKGFEVTATDVSQTAIDKAKKRAEQEGVSVDFVQGDIIQDRIEGQYDIVLDRACLHCLDPEHWPAYVANVKQALRPGGLFVLKCLSDAQKGSSYSHKFTEEEIAGLFSSDFDIHMMSDTVLYGSDETPHQMHLVVMTRKVG